MTMAVDGDIRYKSRPKSARSRVNLFTVGSIAVKKIKNPQNFSKSQKPGLGVRYSLQVNLFAVGSIAVKKKSSKFF